MRKVIKINIPEPCHENWQDMTIKEQGRHCQACSKTVFDFTNKTDEDIVKVYLNNNNLCGRFKIKQLNKDLVLARKSKNSYLSYALSGILSLVTTFSFQKATAQEQPKIERSSSIKPQQIKGKVATSLLHIRTIKGTVLDAAGLSLPGVNVIIKNTTIGTQTDFDGNFELKAARGQTLVFSYVGYKTLEMRIITNFKTDAHYTMEEDFDILGEVIVGGIIAIEDPTDRYQPTPEELKAQKQEAQRIKNYFKFYKRKLKEKKAAKKATKLERKTKS